MFDRPKPHWAVVPMEEEEEEEDVDDDDDDDTDEEEEEDYVVFHCTKFASNQSTYVRNTGRNPFLP